MTWTQLGELLGVTAKQVHTWYSRRARNGFPEPIAHKQTKRAEPSPVFDPDQVLAWHRTYKPGRPGRKPTHGRYIGKAAAEKAKGWR